MSRKHIHMKISLLILLLTEGPVIIYGEGGGGYKTGGKVEFHPYKNWAEDDLAMLKKGGTTSFEVVLTGDT